MYAVIPKYIIYYSVVFLLYSVKVHPAANK